MISKIKIIVNHNNYWVSLSVLSVRAAATCRWTRRRRRRRTRRERMRRRRTRSPRRECRRRDRWHHQRAPASPGPDRRPGTDRIRNVFLHPPLCSVAPPGPGTGPHLRPPGAARCPLWCRPPSRPRARRRPRPPPSPAPNGPRHPPECSRRPWPLLPWKPGRRRSAPTTWRRKTVGCHGDIHCKHR